MADDPLSPTSKDAASQSAALTNLSDAHTDDPSATGGHDSADTVKLGAALSGLSVADKEKAAEKGGEDKKEAPKKVKVAPEDVAFLVEQLEVSKNVATAMLKKAEGSRDKAVEVFVLPKAVEAS